MNPLEGMSQEQIVELAARSEQKQRRRQYRAAIVGGLVAVVGVGLLLLWLVSQVNHIVDTQQAELQQEIQQGQDQAAANARILQKIEDQLVPRSEFDAIEAQLARQHDQLRAQARQLAQLEALARRQGEQLDRIERGVARPPG
jgi:hypothetical protein